MFFCLTCLISCNQFDHRLNGQIVFIHNSTERSAQHELAYHCRDHGIVVWRHYDVTWTFQSLWWTLGFLWEKMRTSSFCVIMWCMSWHDCGAAAVIKITSQNISKVSPVKKNTTVQGKDSNLINLQASRLADTQQTSSPPWAAPKVLKPSGSPCRNEASSNRPQSVLQNTSPLGRMENDGKKHMGNLPSGYLT